MTLEQYIDSIHKRFKPGFPTEQRDQMHSAMCLQIQFLLYLPMIMLIPVTAFSQPEKVTGFDITNVRMVDSLRIAMNDTSSKSTKRSGDEFVFLKGLEFVLSEHDTTTEFRFVKNWHNPVSASINPWWRDVRYLYLYFSGLNAEKLKKKGLLAPKDSVYLNNNERKSPPSDNISNNEVRMGKSQEISKGVMKTEIISGQQVIGFISKGVNLKLDFMFKGQDRIDYERLNVAYPSIVADFPLPMHSGGGKLIELGIHKGQIINYIFSGGNRRSGVIIIDRKGASYPFHIAKIKPSLWSKNYASQTELDLSHHAEDLKQFLKIANKDSLSLVMDMLLIDAHDGQSVRYIKDSTEPGGRRMLVWERQNSGNPALIVLFDGHFTKELTNIAFSLGYHWGIYCDVNYYDNAGYWINGYQRIRFSHIYENENGKPKKPYHRMILY